MVKSLQHSFSRILRKYKNRLLSEHPIPSTDLPDKASNTEQPRSIKIEDLLQRKPIELDQNRIQPKIAGKVILITGASGSIGSQLSKQLVEFSPSKLILLDHYEAGIYELEQFFKPHENDAMQVIAIPCNITDPVQLRQIFEQYIPDIVFHAAAYKHVPLMEHFPYLAVKNNMFGTKNVADLSAKFGVEKFILISTDKAVNPTNVMGATKRLAELYLQLLNSDTNLSTKYIVTRFGNVLGSSGSVVPLFESQIRAGGPVTVTHKDISRYFMTIKEAGQLIVEAGAMGNGGDIFIFEMGDPVKIQDLARKMVQLSGFIPDSDIAIEFTGLRPGEKLYEELLSNDETTIPTYHPKIKIARLDNLPINDLNDKLELLDLTLQTGDAAAIVSLLKSIVPEFISNNSIFEALDIKPKLAEDLIREEISS